MKTTQPNPEKEYAIHCFDSAHPVPRTLAGDIVRRIAGARRQNPEVMLGVSMDDVVSNLGCVALDPESNVVGYVRSKGWRSRIEDDRPVVVEEIGSLYVHPYFRGEHMADQLIGDICRKIGQAIVPDRLEARCRNWPSRRAFEVNGFELAETTDTGVMIMARQLVAASSVRCNENELTRAA